MAVTDTRHQQPWACPTVIPAKAGTQKKHTTKLSAVPDRIKVLRTTPNDHRRGIRQGDALSRLKPLPRVTAGSVGATLVAIFLCRPQWPVTPAFSGPRATLTAAKVLCCDYAGKENASITHLIIPRRVRLPTKCADDPHDSLTLSRPGQ